MLDGVALGVGVGVSLGLGEGVGVLCFDLLLFLGEGLGLGEGEGEAFRCLARWRAGVGVGLTNISLILSPNDGSAARGNGPDRTELTTNPAVSHFVRRGGRIPENTQALFA